MLWYCVNKYQIYIPLHLWQYLSWNYTEELCWCHIPLLGTAVTVPPERQLPFQNGSYRSRKAYAMALPFQNGSYRFRTAVTVPERHMPWYVSGRGGTCHRPLNDLGVSPFFSRPCWKLFFPLRLLVRVLVKKQRKTRFMYAGFRYCVAPLLSFGYIYYLPLPYLYGPAVNNKPSWTIKTHLVKAFH